MMRTLMHLMPAFALIATAGCTEAQSGGDQPGSDLDRLQGMWEITRFDVARPGDGPVQGKLRAIRMSFTGNELTISVGVDYKVRFLATLHPDEKPKRITVIEAKRTDNPATPKTGGTLHASTQPQDRSEWLYKFEGETLVLAVADPGQPAPKDFTAKTFSTRASTAKMKSESRPTGRVDIIHLKKTNSTPIGSRIGTVRSFTGRSRGTRTTTIRTPAPNR